MDHNPDSHEAPLQQLPGRLSMAAVRSQRHLMTLEKPDHSNSTQHPCVLDSSNSDVDACSILKYGMCFEKTAVEWSGGKVEPVSWVLKKSLGWCRSSRVKSPDSRGHGTELLQQPPSSSHSQSRWTPSCTASAAMSATPAAAAATTTATMQAKLRAPPAPTGDCPVESAMEAETPGPAGCDSIAAAASAAAATRPQKVVPPTALLAAAIRGSLHTYARALSKN